MPDVAARVAQVAAHQRRPHGMVRCVRAAVAGSPDSGVIKRMRGVLVSQPVPANWRSGIAGAAGLAIGFAVGTVVSPATAMITAVASSMIAAVGTQGSLRIGLRNAVTVGVAVLVAVMLARLTFSSPWAAAIAMAVIAFTATIIQAVPLIGMPLGMMPGLAFFIVTIKDWGSSTDIGAVGIASLFSIIVAAVVTTLIHLPDPTRDSRRIVGVAFLPQTPFAAHGMASVALRLDSDPPLLTSILQAANFISLGRSLAERAGAGDRRVSAALAQTDAAATELSRALYPRGRLAPRRVPDADLTALDTALAARDVGRAAHLGLENVRSSLADARAFIEGRQTPKRISVCSSPARWLLRGLLNPDDGWFRYGIQRAVSLGLGVLVYKLLNSDAGEEGFWVLLTVYLVMQPGQLATARRAFQRSAGTMVGVGIAVSLSLLLVSTAPLMIMACGLLIVSVAFVARNPAISAALMAAFIAIMVGLPTHEIPRWSIGRLVATVIGCVITLIITSVVLPVRARPLAKAAKARAAIGNVLDAVAASCVQPVLSGSRSPLSTYQAAAIALQDMTTERSLLRDRELLVRYDEVSARLDDSRGDCDALILASASAAAAELVQTGIDRVRVRLSEVDSLIVTLPARA